MEVNYALSGIALILYYIGYSIGFSPSDDEKPSLYGVGAMLTGGFVCLVLWVVAQGSIRSPGAGAVILIFIVVFGALFLFGLGRFLGTLVSVCFVQTTSRLVMVLLTTGLPALAAAMMLYSAAKVEAALNAEQAAARAALQNGTYQARFGAHNVVFPGVPVFAVIHPCGRLDRHCTTRFWTGAGWNNHADGPLELVSFEVNSNPTALQELDNWCAARDAFQGALWCRFTDDDEIRLKRIEDLRGVEAERITRCSPIYNGRFTCRATHDLAPGMVAVLNSLANEEAKARDMIVSKRARAEALWAALTQNAQP